MPQVSNLSPYRRLEGRILTTPMGVARYAQGKVGTAFPGPHGRDLPVMKISDRGCSHHRTGINGQNELSYTIA